MPAIEQSKTLESEHFFPWPLETMDPQSAWTLMMQALRLEDYDEAAMHASNLRDWLTRGGFPPCVVSELSQGCRDPLSVPCKLQYELALKACQFVLFMS